MLTAKWLEENFDVLQSAKGLDDSGIVDDCDMIINHKKSGNKICNKKLF